MKRFRPFTAAQALAAALFLASGCAGAPAVDSAPPDEAVGSPASRPWRITGSGNREEDAGIPPWVTAWLEGEAGAVEALEEYQDRYVFIAVNAGTNFNALAQWQEGFSPELDFARMAARRIENRLLAAVKTNPDSEYGSFYETIVRAASDAEWRGMVPEDNFRIQREYPDADGIQADRESWDFLVLVTVEKTTLAAQINALLQNVKPEFPVTRDQAAAVNRVREQFFEGF